MKLKGLVLTLPVCDWRVFCDPESRLNNILSPTQAEQGKTYIKGFGQYNERRKLRIPWRSTDTNYFDCSRAISLPNQLPDGAPVTHVIRRIYLDNRSLIRFELGIFTNPIHSVPQSSGTFDEFIRKFLESPVRICLRGKRIQDTLSKALPRIVDLFQQMTSTPGKEPAAQCRILKPQIQVIAETTEKEIADKGQPLDLQKNIWIGFQQVSVANQPAPIDAIYLTHIPKLFNKPLGIKFTHFRMIRAHIAWVHADLVVLAEVLNGLSIQNISDREIVIKYVSDLAKGLWIIPSLDEVDYSQIISNLVSFVGSYQGNRIARMLASLEQSPLLQEMKNDLSKLLDRNLRKEEETSIKENRDRPTLDKYIFKALTSYANYITADQEISQERYTDDAFFVSAKRKARETYNRLPDALRKDRILFISIGGADGTELFELLKLTGSKKGFLVELSNRSTNMAREIGKNMGFDVEYYTGDVMQNIDELMNKAIELRTDHLVDSIVITAQAILHELYSRSSQNFTLKRYFSSLQNADVIIGREPIAPYGWPEYVLISGRFSAVLFTNLVTLVRQYDDRFSGKKFEPLRVNDNTVQLHSTLALEALIKAFYSEDFLYELGERVTSISYNNLQQELKLCFPQYSIDHELMTSTSISNYWGKYNLKAENSDNRMDLGKPFSHTWYRVIKE